ncbi:MAG: hypothetical protein EXQ63_04250 [Ilumatobacteraceae bacterium]|nr:hypothetical protein [Ilumatobacteraceae bacterium]
MNDINKSSRNNAFSRRTMLRTSGITITAGMLLAACTKKVSTGALPRIGESPTTTVLPEGLITDEVLLRTAMSVEYNAIDTYATVIEAKIFKAGTNNLLKRFSQDHESHAEALSGLIKELNGSPYKKANPNVTSLYINPALDLVTSSEDPTADALVLAHALETLAAQTYQAFVVMLLDPALRSAAMSIADQEARHTVVLAQAIRPGLAGLLPGTNEAGKPLIAAIPSAFGSLSTIPIAVGKPNESGNKTTLVLETPSLNSFIYDYID